MTEVMTGNADLMALYNDVFASLNTSVKRAASHAKKAEVSPLEIESQCIQIDELWVELGNCIQKWRGYDDEFIASRFANMHYLGSKGTSSGYAYPPDDVWTYLVNKIHDWRKGKVTIMLIHQDNKKVIRSWR